MPQKARVPVRVFRKGARLQWWLDQASPVPATALRADRSRDMTQIRLDSGRDYWAYNDDLTDGG